MLQLVEFLNLPKYDILFTYPFQLYELNHFRMMSRHYQVAKN